MKNTRVYTTYRLSPAEPVAILIAHVACCFAGSTTHVIDTQRGLVVEHIEAWKSDPKEVHRTWVCDYITC